MLTVTGLGTVTCNSTVLNATVGTGGGATITGSLNSLDFTSCADTIPVISITSCSAVPTLPSITVTATGTSAGTIALTDTTVFCHVTGGTSGCYYTAASAVGNVTGADLAYSNVSVTHTTGSGDLGSLCGAGASFSVTVQDVRTPTIPFRTVTVSNF